MTKFKSTKRALLASGMALVLCVSMLVGSTFAWFTDSVTTAGNTIQSGTLQVDLVDEDGNSLENKVLAFEDKDGNDLWEPGCTYNTQKFFVKNNGNLALQYQIAINGIEGNAKLLEAIDWTITVDGVKTDVADLEGKLLQANDQSAAIVLSGHMKEEAGNEYQGLTVEGISVSVFATQYTYEKDSKDDQYDKNAAWDGTIPTTKPESLVVDTDAKLISINDIEAFAYLNTLLENESFRATYGSTWQYSIELNTDVNLLGRPWTPIKMSNFVAFDGKGHTISNLNVSADSYAGLFAQVSCNDTGVTYVRNLNINGATVTGNKYVGVVAGSSPQGAIENVTVNNAVVSGIKYVGGFFGWGNGSVNGSTIKNSAISIDKIVIDPKDNSIDAKEAGALIGYLSNDGIATTESKIIANNHVENVTIKAPTIASGLVAQPNSSNKGGAVIEVKNNTMKNVTITTTEDATAALFVSNNVGGKTIVKDNTYENVTLKTKESTQMGDSDKGVDVPKDVELPDDAKFVMTDPIIDEKNKTVTIEDASFKDANGNEVDLSNNTTPITVTIKVPFTDGETFDIKHNDEYITTAIVTDGKIVYECLHFCKILITDAKMTAVSTADELVEALEAGEDVIFTNDIKIDPANMSNAYGKTGINVKKGQTIDGNGFTLNIQGAGGTWDSGINTTGGIIRNIKVTGSFRGIFVNHNSDYSETVVLENVTIEGTTYTISCDQGMNQNLEAYNCTFNGWTSFAATLGTAKFVDCNFGEGKGYAYCRPYAPTTFVGCKFEAGYEVDTRAASTFEKCTLGGVDVTEDNLATLVTANIDKASVK